MAWTAKQKKAHSERMKNVWAKKALDAVKTVRREQAASLSTAAWEATTGLKSAIHDMVNHPPHYTATKYEVADVADEWYPTEPHLWQANKYMARWDKKGDPVENLEKAVWYLQRKVNLLKEKQNA